MKNTIAAKLVAICDDTYTKYVFQNTAEPENSKYRYLMLTRCPNWQYYKPLKVGDEGYVEYEIAIAGEEYYNYHTNKSEVYSQTALYFINFIPKQSEDNVKEFNF